MKQYLPAFATLAFLGGFFPAIGLLMAIATSLGAK
jgi:hypothetical protein